MALEAPAGERARVSLRVTRQTLALRCPLGMLSHASRCLFSCRQGRGPQNGALSTFAFVIFSLRDSLKAFPYTPS